MEPFNTAASDEAPVTDVDTSSAVDTTTDAPSSADLTEAPPAATFTQADVDAAVAAATASAPTADPTVATAANAPAPVATPATTEDLLAHPAVQAAIAQALQDHTAANAEPDPIDYKSGQLVEFASVDIYGPHGPEEVVRNGIIIDLLEGDPDAPDGSVEREDRATIAWLDVSGPMFTSDLRPRPEK